MAYIGKSTPISVEDTVSKSAGGTFGGDVGVTGTLTATSFSGSGLGLSDIIFDTTPQLGGNLDANTKNITNIGTVTSSGYTATSSGSGTVDGLIITNSDTANNGLSIGVDSSENAFIWNGSNTELRFATNNSQKMVIDENGNVGIGVSPSNPGWARNLHVHGAGNGGGLQLTDNTSGSGNNDGLSIASYQGNSYFINRENAFMVFSTNDTERMRIDSNGNVLVGMLTNSITSTGIGLVKDGVSHMYSGVTGTNATLMLGRGGSDGNVLSFNRSGTTFGSIGGGTSSGELVISTNSGIQYISQKLTGDTDGIQYSNNGTYHLGPWLAKNDTVDLGRSNSGWRNLYLTGGIQFDARSNKLDDYEEGTWTPTIKGYAQGNPHSETYSLQNGNYTKVGNLVTAHFYVTLSNEGNIASGSGAYSFISSLPFTHAGSTAGSGVMWGWHSLNTGVSHVGCDMSSTSTLAWITQASGTSATQTGYLHTSQITNTTSFRGTLIYKTNS